MISGDLETRGTASFGGVASVSGNFFTYGTNTFSSTGSSSFAGSLSVAKGFLAGANNAFVVNANATANTLNVVGANVGIGTTAPIAIADIEPADGTAGPLFRVASGSNERLRIQSDGNVGIGTINVDTKFEVAGTASISSNVYLKGLGTVTDDRSVCAIAATGELELVNGACGTSSLRYKENIAGLDYGLAEIAKLNPVFFNYTKDSLASASLSLIDNRTKRRVGFIAEEVNEIIPEVVIWQDGRIENIDYAHLTSILTKGVQELKSLFDALTAKIEPILAWFVNGKFVVQNDICVDEVCVTKEQFKALLNQVQMTNGQMSPKESQSDPTGQANQIQSSNSQIPIPATTTTPLVNESPAPTTASASVSESQIPQNVLSSDGGTPNQTEQSSDGTGQAPQSGEDATAGQATDDGEPTLAVPIPSPSLEPSPTISPENTPEPPPETTPEIQPENE
ncbi:MAG: tail fiber domain-containing protein [Candidatus Yanofskybacteria bacterium]|nr:tail fiber domain-containing protein [Candidatus Yanofskybacteria bacterium]